MVITLLFTLMSELCTPQVNNHIDQKEINTVLYNATIIEQIKNTAENPSDSCIEALLSKINTIK